MLLMHGGRLQLFKNREHTLEIALCFQNDVRIRGHPFFLKALKTNVVRPLLFMSPDYEVKQLENDAVD